MALLLAIALPLAGQTATPLPDSAATPAPSTPAVQSTNEPAPPPASIRPLLDFRPSDIKFNLADLTDLLRDHRHEGWVLAAYPDPKTSRPLIGAGFTLDLPEREHLQADPLNPHTFVEPSSAQLWQAAGLDPALLQHVLDQFSDNLAAWRTAHRFRRKIRSLDPQITNDQAAALLRISAIQAIVNARGWCRNFDQLTGPQQMAVSQLVYQMGVNLGQFSTFLSLINNDPVGASPLADPGAARPAETSAADLEHWHTIQQSLMQSQWAHLYRVRATSVIAMLDPRYLDNPSASEARIAAVLRPARHRRHSRALLRTASYHRRSNRNPAIKSLASRAKRKT
jgi:hypothetical protein